MEVKNKLNQVSLANISNQELNEIKELEQKLGNKFFLIAFDKEQTK
ncbi:MAG: hypothetical protein ACOWWO_04140 [Peptococcaceae bacterium]